MAFPLLVILGWHLLEIAVSLAVGEACFEGECIEGMFLLTVMYLVPLSIALTCACAVVLLVLRVVTGKWGYPCPWKHLIGVALLVGAMGAGLQHVVDVLRVVEPVARWMS